ncbi:MAG: EAL domain-containing protein [Phycisphaerae bacterium]|nr:EAL domain-containing protein [Phycisphaerae bacterium]
MERLSPFGCEGERSPSIAPGQEGESAGSFDEFGQGKTTVANYGTRRLHVLVVDDDLLFARTCARFLEAAGHIVAIAENSRSAIQTGHERRFDAVVTDINLPDGNGLEVLQKLRQCDPHLPFVLVTGDPDLDTARAAVECGAVSYLLKPISAMQLESVIERAFRAKRNAELLQAAGRREEEQQATRECFERALAGLWIAFQPIISWSSRGVAGYEALLRTNEPSFSSPLDLLKAARELHRLIPFGRRIRGAVAALMFGHDEVPQVFVNLHALEILDEDLYEQASPLAAFADHVIFEITEQAAIEDIVDFIARTRRLRAMGYRIAVSDIVVVASGSARRSLALLKPDNVKFDISLLRGIPDPVARQRALEAVVSFCRNLAVPLVATKVETEADRDAFLAAGGDLMQGYLFAHPDFPLPAPVF